MKIVSLHSENVKRLKAVTIKPDGSLVEITGKNGQGKTSVLDSIWWALAGSKNIQAQPIRKGEEKALIRLDLGDLIVTRKFTAGGSSVIVEKADGARYKSPQQMLDALIGDLSFDPLAFTRMDAKKQFEAMRQIANLGGEIDALDGQNRTDFENRTEVNRKVKEQNAAAATVVVPAGLPEDPVDEAALLQAMQDAADHNATLERRKSGRAQVARDIADQTAEADRLVDQIADLKEQLENTKRIIEQKQNQLDTAEPLPEPIDVSAVRQSLEQAQRTNAGIRQRDLKKKHEDAAAKAQQEADALTAAIDHRTKVKADLIAKAEFPVPGLGLGDGEVTYNGVPFDQASASEQLRVSVAIAMAANPTLRVIRITDGSLLDEDAMAILGEMAADKDFQVWIERVDSSGKIGVVIEDGMVKETAPAEEPGQPAQSDLLGGDQAA